MKNKPHRPLTRRLAGAAVPQFVALLGVLREAAERGLDLLSDPPAPLTFPRLGKNHARLFQGLGKSAAP